MAGKAATQRRQKAGELAGLQAPWGSPVFGKAFTMTTDTLMYFIMNSTSGAFFTLQDYALTHTV